MYLTKRSWRAVGCFLRLPVKRRHKLSGHYLSTWHSHQRSGCEKVNHGPPGLGHRAEMKPFHFSSEQTKVQKCHKRDKVRAISCWFSSSALVAAQNLLAFLPGLTVHVSGVTHPHWWSTILFRSVSDRWKVCQWEPDNFCPRVSDEGRERENSEPEGTGV